jgi:U1 small nuclear ribonucleoprotein
MTDKLPPQLLALFAPRPPLRYALPADTAAEKRKTATVSGIAHLLPQITLHDQDYTPTDTAEQAKEKRRAAKAARIQKLLRDGAENYTPAGDQQARGDPYHTLFVSRLSYETTEHDLEKEFSKFGPVERVIIPPILRFWFVADWCRFVL